MLAAAAHPACLPADTRPEPGSVLTTVSGSEATRNGVTTADGWSLTIEKALLGIGPIQLGDDCTKYAEYSEPGYDRVLDVTREGAQKLSIMYGLGRCDMDFQISPPSEDAVLGGGVGEADKAYMRTPGSDRYLVNEGVTLHLAGRATQGARSLRFAWDFRQSLFYTQCSATIDGVFEPGLDLRGGVPLSYDLLIEAEAFFRDDVARESALRFEPFARADSARGNGDGSVELEELAQVALSDLRASAPYGTNGEPGVDTLADYLYRVLYRTFLRFRDTGSCAVALEED
jgi:hypothetical protein